MHGDGTSSPDVDTFVVFLRNGYLENNAIYTCCCH